MSCCWFIVVCCTPCWGEALLPSKKVVFECFGIRIFYIKIPPLLFPECSCYLLQKSWPGSAAGGLLHVLLLVYNCLLYTLLGGSLAAFKKSGF